MGVVLMANDFTVFASSIAELYDDYDPNDPEDMRERMMLADAVLMYGLHGVEIELPKSVKRAFKGLKNAIDNSKNKREQAKKGGRPRKAKAEPEPEPESEQKTETEVSESGNQGFENGKPRFSEPETEVSESENQGFENGKPRFSEPETEVSESENPNLACPSLALPSLACVDGARGGDADGFVPPTLDECRAYFAANCISGDPDKFWAHYESQGWIRSNGIPVASLKAAAMLWNGNQKRLDAEAHARGKPTDAEIQAATFKPTRTPEQTRAELERRWREEHPGIDPAKVKAPRGTTADPVALKAYQDARRLLDARAACERRAS